MTRRRSPAAIARARWTATAGAPRTVEAEREAMRVAAVAATFAADVIEQWVAPEHRWRQRVVRRLWPRLAQAIDLLEQGARPR